VTNGIKGYHNYLDSSNEYAGPSLPSRLLSVDGFPKGEDYATQNRVH
jgi:hypothetical protein